MGAQLVLAGLYTPVEFGHFYVATAAGALLAIVATGRYEMAIPLTDGDDEADAVTAWALMLATVVSALLVLVAVVAGLGPWAELAAARLGPALWLVPVLTWATALFTILRMRLGRSERFGVVSLSTLSSTIVQSITQIGAALVGATTLGLPVGYAAGRLVGSAGMCSRVGRLLRRPAVPFAEIARRWRRFPVFNTWPALLNGISASAVAPVVALMFGAGFAGHFGFASYVLAAPAALLGQAVATVFFPAMARMEREGAAVAAALHRMAAALLLVSVPVFAVVAVFGPDLFALLPTGVWREAGVIAALLSPWLAMSFVSSPLSSYATVKNRLGRLLVVSVIEAVVRLGGLAMGLVFGPLVGVACYSAAGVGICVYFVGWTMRLAGSGLGSWLATIRGPLTLSVACLVAAGAARLLLPEVAGVVVAAIALVALAAVSVLGLRRVRVTPAG